MQTIQDWLLAATLLAVIILLFAFGGVLITGMFAMVVIVFILATARDVLFGIGSFIAATIKRVVRAVR